MSPSAESDKKCFQCNSNYKVSEVDPGLFICSGFCRKNYLNKKAAMASRAAAAAAAGAKAGAKEPESAPAQKEEASGAGDDPAPASSFEVGAFCRAVYSLDEKEYEGRLLSRDEDAEGNAYGVVEFVGYKNQETVWVDNLLPSRGERARARQEEDAEGAANLEEGGGGEFKAGDPCVALYSADNTLYEGTLMDVEKDDQGREYGTVRFVGYGNEEKVYLTELQKSKGDAARETQKKEAAAAANPEAAAATEETKKEEAKEKGGSSEAAEWKEGDHCAAVFTEDGVKYEATVASVAEDGGGRKYAIVRFLGYNNEESHWLEELMKSDGEAARAKQVKESGGVAEVEAAVVADAAEGEEKQATEAKAEEQTPATAANAAPVEEKKVEAEKVNGQEEKTSNKAEEAVAKKAEDWQVGDFVLAAYAEDGLDYEGVVMSVGSSDDGPYCAVKFLGYGNEETVWAAELRPSQGQKARKAQIAQAEAAAAAPTTKEEAPKTQEQEQQTAEAATPVQAETKAAPTKEEEPAVEEAQPVPVAAPAAAASDPDGAKLRKEYDDLKREHTALNRKYDILKKGNVELHREKKEVSQAAIMNLEKFQEKYNALEKSKEEELKKAREEFEKSNEKYSNLLSVSKDDNKKLLGKFEALQKTCSELKENHKKLSEKVAALELANSELKEENDELKATASVSRVNSSAASVSIASDETIEEANLVETPTKSYTMQQQQNYMQQFMMAMMPQGMAAAAGAGGDAGGAAPMAVPVPMMFCMPTMMPQMPVQAAAGGRSSGAGGKVGDAGASGVHMAPKNQAAPPPTSATGVGSVRPPLRRPLFNPQATSFSPASSSTPSAANGPPSAAPPPQTADNRQG